MLPQLPDEAKQALQQKGVWERPSEFEEGHYPVTRRFIEESVAHDILDGPPVSVKGPIHILHGTRDEVVPLSHARRLHRWMGRKDAILEVIEGGDHRLSDDESLERLSGLSLLTVERRSD
jgi:pimeloyl-ACP methyl ester carboxylesterase